MTEPAKSTTTPVAGEVIEQVTTAVGDGIQAASDRFSGKPAGVGETITQAFGDSATGPKWGAVGGASIITLVTGLLGFTMGGPLGALAGVAGGLTIGTLIGPALNGMWEQMGFPAAAKPPMPGREPEAQADPDVGLLRGIEISQPGTLLPDKTNMLVPNLKRFKEVSSESAGLVKDLVSRRATIDAMPHSALREGAIKRLLVDEEGASKLLANAQLWDQMVAEWSKSGGERDKLKTALGAAMNANGQRFYESMIPTPPVVEVNVPPLPKDLENYALDMIASQVPEGSTRAAEIAKKEAEWRQQLPQDQLNYVWNMADQEAKRNEPDWSKAGEPVFGIGPRQTSRSPINSVLETIIGETDFAAMQGDCMIKFKQCAKEGNYERALHFAQLGIEVADAGRGFSPDQEAKMAFEKAHRFASARLVQQQASGQYEQVYKEIQRVEAISKKQFPEFIAEVEKLEAKVRELNAKTQEQNRLRTAAADVPAPTSAPSTPPKTTAVEEEKAPASTPSH